MFLILQGTFQSRNKSHFQMTYPGPCLPGAICPFFKILCVSSPPLNDLLLIFPRKILQIHMPNSTFRVLQVYIEQYDFTIHDNECVSPISTELRYNGLSFWDYRISRVQPVPIQMWQISTVHLRLPSHHLKNENLETDRQMVQVDRAACIYTNTVITLNFRLYMSKSR